MNELHKIIPLLRAIASLVSNLSISIFKGTNMLPPPIPLAEANILTRNIKKIPPISITVGGHINLCLHSPDLQLKKEEEQSSEVAHSV